MSVTAVQHIAFKSNMGDFILPVATVSETLSQIRPGGTYIESAETNGILVTSPVATANSSEFITPLNINESVEFALDGHKFGFKRISATQFEYYRDQTTSTVTPSGTWYYIIIGVIITSDDVWLGHMSYRNGTGQYINIDTSNIFPLINETTPNLNSFSGYFYNNDTDKLVGNILRGSVVSGDPYAGAGDSTTGGGGGTFDGSSDPVAVPSLPSVGATDSGFITLFAPTIAQLKALAEYMWVNPLFDVETGFKKLFSDPMDCILGLSVVPVTVPTSGAQNVNVGNLITSVTMNVASQQYIEVDCGSIDFSNQYFGSYLDFEPYTKMALFVPYSGIHSVCADDIIGKTVNLIYHIDILTGSLVAFLKCGNSVLYEFNGACASNIPVNSMNYASTIENAIRIAVNIGTTVATAGAAAPATTAATGATTARNIATGINLAGSTAEGALSLKPNIDRAGSLGGTTGLMGNQIPYFIITRPRLCKPKNQNKYKGYPSFIECVIGDLEGKGYTEFDTVILENSYLTDSEKDELIGILKEGVFL